VSSNAFYFSLTLPPQVSQKLLRELVERVSSTTGCPAEDTAELVRQVEEAVAKAAPKGPCEVRFETRDRTLGVTVHCESRQILEAFHPID
jgi:hypothetical protein